MASRQLRGHHGNRRVCCKFNHTMLSAWRTAPMCGHMTALRTSWHRQVGFTYPGASKQQLSDVNVRVALSSRIAVLGANGAGKVGTLCWSMLWYSQCQSQFT